MSASPPPPPDERLDTRGLLCPLPVLYAARRLAAMEPGSVLEVVGTDRGMLEDFPALCAERGHRLLAMEESANGEIRVVLAKGSAAPEG